MIDLNDDEVKRAFQLVRAIEQRLRDFGYSAAHVQNNPLRCFDLATSNLADADWRDCFLALLAAGKSPLDALEYAGTCTRLMRERKAKCTS